MKYFCDYLAFLFRNVLKMSSDYYSVFVFIEVSKYIKEYLNQTYNALLSRYSLLDNYFNSNKKTLPLLIVHYSNKKHCM